MFIPLKNLKPKTWYKSARGNRFCLLNSFGLGESFAFYTNCDRFVMIETKRNFILSTIKSIKFPVTKE